MTGENEIMEDEQLSADVVNLEGANIEIVEADHVTDQVFSKEIL